VARRFARLGRSPAKIPPSDPVRPIAPNAILIPGGHATPFFMTDPGNGLTDLCGVRVLVADMDLADMSPVIHPTELAMREGVPLVVLARSLNGAALALLTVNKLRGIVSAAGAGVALPAVDASALLRKVAGVTGGQLMANPADMASCSASAFGRASRVLMARSWTIVDP
jgi:chaperonin GroEL